MLGLVAYYKPPPKIQRVEVEKPVIVKEVEIVEKPVIVEKMTGTHDKESVTASHGRSKIKHKSIPRPLVRNGYDVRYQPRVRCGCQSGYPCYEANGYWESPYRWHAYR